MRPRNWTTKTLGGTEAWSSAERKIHRAKRLFVPQRLEVQLSPTSRTHVGLLCIAGAIGLYFLSFFFQDVGYLLPSSGLAGQESLYLGLRLLWIPLIGTVLMGAIAAVFVVGVWFVWSDRARLDSGQRAYLGLAALAFALSFGAAGCGSHWAFSSDSCTPPTFMGSLRPWTWALPSLLGSRCTGFCSG